MKKNLIILITLGVIIILTISGSSQSLIKKETKNQNEKINLPKWLITSRVILWGKNLEIGTSIGLDTDGEYFTDAQPYTEEETQNIKSTSSIVFKFNSDKKGSIVFQWFFPWVVPSFRDKYIMFDNFEGIIIPLSADNSYIVIGKSCGQILSIVDSDSLMWVLYDILKYISSFFD